MLVFYGILLAILLGLWAWTRRTAWAIPVAIVAVLFIATWLNFRWDVTTWLIIAAIAIALGILFARVLLGVILAAVALFIAVAIGLSLAFPSTPPEANNGTKEPIPSATATATGTPTATCDPKFVQEKADYGPDNRVDGNFEKEYATTVANKTGAEKEKAQRELILKHSANNGQRLAIWAHANGLHGDPNDWKKLVASDCLSQEGQALYYKLDGALSATGTTFSEADAPQNGYNSGVVDGNYVVAEKPGIVSNPKAIEITRKDGSKVYILIYCGNVVFPAPPANVPTSPVIPQPPQTCPEGMSGVPPNCEIPPAPVCPPGMSGVPPNCLEWKIPAQDPAQNGNSGNGGGLNADPGPGTYIPAEQMQQPPAEPRVNPAPPAAAEPAPAPVVVPVIPTEPQPTVDPATQPPNNGSVDPAPTAGPCNPDFQNCP